MKRKLSNIEHILDGNVMCLVSLDGSFSLDQIRSALSRVQGRHPALRALVREESDGLYYEDDCAPQIPLHIVSGASEDDREGVLTRNQRSPPVRGFVGVLFFKSDETCISGQQSRERLVRRERRIGSLALDATHANEQQQRGD